MDIADLTVTSVSKRPQRLEDAAAAVYVITQEDIHRTGVTSIPDALRMVPGVQVAQTGSHGWNISIRGFNSGLSNKLLVLVDGRSVYTPVYGGTYWDDQFIPLEEIDHIEVIRGPGGATWGANAMDGVINIITKHASTTQGSVVSETIGTHGEDETVLQHGDKIGDGEYYRGYGSYVQRSGTTTSADTSGHDAWSRERAGFRYDADRSDGNSFFLSGSAYHGDLDEKETLTQPTAPFKHTDFNDNEAYGGDIIGRWDHRFSNDSTGSLQMYVDHYSRLEEVANQHITTVDLDWLHNLQTSERNHFSWGLGYRDIMSDIEGSFEIRVGNDTYQQFNIFSAFVQDDYQLIPDKLTLTLGSKFEHNDFTGYEAEPTARLSYKISDNQTAWAAVSHSVRTPSIIEDEINLIFSAAPGPTYGVILGNAGLGPESLDAYEIGYRIEPTPRLQIDTTAYFNRYHNLETVSPETPFVSMAGNFIIPFVAVNGGEGDVYGAEASATYRVTPNWKLLGSATLGKMDLSTVTGTSTLDATESAMPQSQFSAASYWNVTPTVQWDNMLYYVEGIGAPTHGYVRYDTRLGWHVMPDLEVSVIGQNLFEPQHAEFPGVVATEIDRSLIGRVTLKF